MLVRLAVAQCQIANARCCETGPHSSNSARCRRWRWDHGQGSIEMRRRTILVIVLHKGLIIVVETGLFLFVELTPGIFVFVTRAAEER